jgi:hypothetical protein
MSAGTRSKQRKTAATSSAAPPFPPFLRDLANLQAADEVAWPFDLELTGAWDSTAETRDMLASWTGAKNPDCWVRVFGSDGTGGKFAVLCCADGELVGKEAIVLLGSEGELGVFGTIATFATLLGKGIDAACLTVNMDDGAAERRERSADADGLPMVNCDDEDDDSSERRGKRATVAAVAKLTKKHFKIDPENVNLSDLLADIEQPVSLHEFCKFVLAKTQYVRD